MYVRSFTYLTQAAMVHTTVKTRDREWSQYVHAREKNPSLGVKTDQLLNSASTKNSTKLKAGHSLECKLTSATRSSSVCFITLWQTVWPCKCVCFGFLWVKANPADCTDDVVTAVFKLPTSSFTLSTHGIVSQLIKWIFLILLVSNAQSSNIPNIKQVAMTHYGLSLRQVW